MMQLPELNAFKDIPGYKAILKAVIKSQIQFLVSFILKFAFLYYSSHLSIHPLYCVHACSFVRSYFCYVCGVSN